MNDTQIQEVGLVDDDATTAPFCVLLPYILFHTQHAQSNKIQTSDVMPAKSEAKKSRRSRKDKIKASFE
jgi:hypothetical protein